MKSKPLVSFCPFLTTSFQTLSGGLARHCFHCCFCRVGLWHHVITEACLQHVLQGPIQPAAGLAAFHHHQHLFHPSHQYVGYLCKVPVGHCHLKHFTNYGRLPLLVHIGQKSPHLVLADIHEQPMYSSFRFLEMDCFCC